MTYEEFLELFKAKAQSELSYTPDEIEFFPEGYTSDDPQILSWIMDTNRRYAGQESPWLVKDFMTLTKNDINTTGKIVQRLAIREIYEDAEKNGFDSAFSEIRKTHENINDVKIDTVELSKRSTGTYGDIIGQLIIRPLNYPRNIQELQGHVYRRIGDLVLALYQFVGSSEHSVMSSKIRRDELERWGVSQEQAMHDALENTMKLFPACVYNYKKGQEVDFLAEDFAREDITEDGKMILLSTFRVTNGATALFYPGVVSKMKGIMGGAFTAVFANVNDVLIFDKRSGYADKYLKNAKYLNPDLLSVRTYICDEKGIIPE